MRSQKVLSNNQIKWQDEGNSRLNYQMLFNENVEEPEEKGIDEKQLLERLKERDEKWKKRLQEEKERSYQKGFEDGEKEGFYRAEDEIDAKIKVVKSAIAQGHQEWRERQRLIEPGILDLVFEICERILGIPVENPEIKENLEQKLIPIFRKLDREGRPVLKVSSSDMKLIDRLKETHASEMTMYIEADPKCKPGEFELETNKETIVHKFGEMLKEFKKNLSLPTWN